MSEEYVKRKVVIYLSETKPVRRKEISVPIKPPSPKQLLLPPLIFVIILLLSVLDFDIGISLCTVWAPPTMLYVSSRTIALLLFIVVVSFSCIGVKITGIKTIAKSLISRSKRSIPTIIACAAAICYIVKEILIPILQWILP